MAQELQKTLHIYSFFNSVAGLVRAERITCQITEAKAIASDIMVATANTQP